MARLISGAHGAPVDATNVKDDKSYRARTSGARRSMRTYMTGTR